MSSSSDFRIQPVTYADVKDIARITKEAFMDDRNTKMKKLGTRTYTDESGMWEGVVGDLKRERYVFRKAVSAEGELMGFMSFFCQGIPIEDIPRSDPGSEVELSRDETSKGSLQGNIKGIVEAKDNEELNSAAVEAVENFEAMTSADMKRWKEILMPPGSKCLVFTAVSVSPRFQGLGIGSALVNWAAACADKFGVYMWVHSSEAAVRTYEKAGFEVVGSLEVDLDAWAPEPPRNEGIDAKWGHYTFRYMKRLPKSA